MIANDGINTAMDVSDQPFTVATHSPQVYIDSPFNGEAFRPGWQEVVRGGAMDAEDGSLNGRALTWSIDGQPVGLGVDFTLRDLLPGQHTLVLQAIDSDGDAGSAQIIFQVAYPIFLPILRTQPVAP